MSVCPAYLMRVFCIIELAIEQVQRFLNLSNLFNKPVIWRIPAQFNIWTVSSSFETGLRHLKWSLLIPNRLLKLLDVFLLFGGKV
jgi:hypothetical protein